MKGQRASGSNGRTYRYRWGPGAKVLLPSHANAGNGFSSIDDLRSCLRFSPGEGRIWFENDRLILLHLSTLGLIRQTLLKELGERDTRGLLTRMGYASGVRDAVIAKRIRPDRSFRDAFLVGPQLHQIFGMVVVQPVHLEMDANKGVFHGEWIWNWCCDAENHLEVIGRSNKPVCWMQLGYATGYTSAFVGQRIIYREVECQAMGDPQCRIVGKHLHGWNPREIEEELRALQPEDFANRPVKRRQILFSQPAPRSSALNGRDKSMVDLVGASQGFISTCHMLQKVANTSATVLFLGETGVGKGLFARALRQISDRADRPFVAINCAAIPENLIEAELFGVEKGAFTDATESRAGRFERADGGTLFLDEVSALTPTSQVKLLRVLQEREVERLGGRKTINVDVRIVAATNDDLREAVKKGHFREDLWFRLNVFPINVPPLRERREDIPLLMDYFLHLYGMIHGKQASGFTPLAIDALYQYDYPGNIRELENLIERAIIMVDSGQAIDVKHLFVDEDILVSVLLKLNPEGMLDSKQARGRDDDIFGEIFEKEIPYAKVEAGLIEEAMKRTSGNVAKAARLLGMKRSQVAYRLQQSSSI